MASAVANLHNRNSNNTRFNAEAAAWDSRPFVHQASQAAARAILAELKARDKDPRDLNVLEIGCGTGILSFLLAPEVKSIVAVDAAEGMIDVLKQKLSKPEAPDNIIPLALLLEDPNDPALPPADPTKPNGHRQQFDLITSHLVLHHIPQLEGVLKTMYGCLAPDGRSSVMLTDFEHINDESKRFHPASKMDGVARHGINARDMTTLMQQVGYRNVDVRSHWSMTKTVEKFDGEFGGEYGGKAAEFAQKEGMGEDMDFGFVLCYGTR